MQLNLPANVLADARGERRFPKGSMDIRFAMEKVTSTYYKDLPAISAEAGEAQLARQ